VPDIPVVRQRCRAHQEWAAGCASQVAARYRSAGVLPFWCGRGGRAASILPQAAFVEFIASGDFAAHICCLNRLMLCFAGFTEAIIQAAKRDHLAGTGS